MISRLRVGSSRLVMSLVAIGHMVLQTPKLLDTLSMRTLETFVLKELLTDFPVTHSCCCCRLDCVVLLNILFVRFYLNQTQCNL